MAGGPIRPSWTPWHRLFALLLSLTYLLPSGQGIYLQGTERSYARYPKWNACVNASISFEFQTTQQESTLLYVDDGGKYDYFDMLQTNGRVRLLFNIVDGTDGSVQIDLATNVNDGHWHRVEIRRNRMETILTVDEETGSRYAFGSDFHFGDLGRPEARIISANSEVFIGGVPSTYGVEDSSLSRLANPEVFWQPRFRGSIRNVLYNNCTCLPVRAPYLGGEDVNLYPREDCEIRNPCRAGCICVSTDGGSDCDCSERDCQSGKAPGICQEISRPLYSDVIYIKRQHVSNCLFKRLFKLTTTPKLNIIGPVGGESTGDRWIPLTKA